MSHFAGARCKFLMLYAHDNVSIYFFYTLWKRIEWFNVYYLIINLMMFLLLLTVNNSRILLMALLNAIDGKNRWSLYRVTLLSLLLAIDNRPTRLVVMTWHCWCHLVSQVFGDTCGRQNHCMVLSHCWPIAAWLQRTLLLANDCMMSLFCVIDNSFNKQIN